MKNLLYLFFFSFVLGVWGCKNNSVIIDADSFIGFPSQRLYERLGSPIKGCIFIAKNTNNSELNTTFIGYQSGTRLLVFHIQKDLVMDYHYSNYYNEALYNKTIGNCTVKEVYKKLGSPFAYGYTAFFDDYKVFRLFYKVKPERKMFFLSKKHNKRYLIITFRQEKKGGKPLSYRRITVHDFAPNKKP